MKIIPSILTGDREQFQNELLKYNVFFDEIQIDIADGVFVPNKTLGMEVQDIIPENIKISLHLMVNSPWEYITQIKTNNITSCICHVEVSADFADIKNKLVKLGVVFGLAVNPDTNMDSYLETVTNADFIQLMGVNPGFQGQQFIPKTLEKYEALKKTGKPVWLDGGINEKTIDLIRDYDFQTIVVGSYFQSGDLNYKLQLLKERLWIKD